MRDACGEGRRSSMSMIAGERQQKRARERDRPVVYEEHKHESSNKDRRREDFFVFRVALALMRAFSAVSLLGFDLAGFGRRWGATSASFTATTRACSGRRTGPPRWNLNWRTVPGISPQIFFGDAKLSTSPKCHRTFPLWIPPFD